MEEGEVEEEEENEEEEIEIEEVEKEEEEVEEGGGEGHTSSFGSVASLAHPAPPAHTPEDVQVSP